MHSQCSYRARLSTLRQYRRVCGSLTKVYDNLRMFKFVVGLERCMLAVHWCCLYRHILVALLVELEPYYRYTERIWYAEEGGSAIDWHQ